MPTVFVIAQDRTLRASVRAELREQGVEALGFESVEDAGRARVEGAVPDVLVLDSTSTSLPEIPLRALARAAESVVVVSSTLAAPRLPFTPTALLVKPVRIGEIVAAVRRLLEGRPA